MRFPLRSVLCLSRLRWARSEPRQVPLSAAPGRVLRVFRVAALTAISVIITAADSAAFSESYRGLWVWARSPRLPARFPARWATTGGPLVAVPHLRAGLSQAASQPATATVFPGFLDNLYHRTGRVRVRDHPQLAADGCGQPEHLHPCRGPLRLPRAVFSARCLPFAGSAQVAAMAGHSS